MTQKLDLSKSSGIELPDEVKQYVGKLLDTILKDEEEDYRSTLVPFSQYKKQKIAQKEAEVRDFYIKLQQAQNLLQSKLPEETWQSWVDAIDRLYTKVQETEFEVDQNETSILELSGVSFDFARDCYTVGQKLLEEKRQDEALLVFMFLRYIDPENAAFWFCEALSLQETHDLKGALDAYNRSLDYDKNPDALFQVAKILYQLNQKDACIDALTTTIYAMQDKDEYDHMRKIATNFKAELMAQTAA